MIVVVDYGMGNLGSLRRAFQRMGVSASMSADPEDVNQATKLILPGVGHFGRAMTNLAKLHLLDVLCQRVLVDRVPILGICLGMQLLSKHSDEGDTDGLKWIDAHTVKFDSARLKIKVPHMGWNELTLAKDSAVMRGVDGGVMFYFVHSYYMVCNDQKDVLATTVYGCDFTSAVERENIVGTQFHPEKSRQTGFRVLRNFVEYY